MTIDARILAIKDKKEQDVQVMKMLSMNLWRRINAGYNIPRRKPMSQFKRDFPDDPLLKIAPAKEYNRKRDSFTEYSEAVCRLDQSMGKPPIVVAPFVPQHIKIAEMKKRIAERKARDIAALNKGGSGPKPPEPKAKK
ncbi:hypothetical protein KC19_7G065300 [Ceratodon purpureus]|uniref:Uncharacterized protein n=1 Tax=Ceratodon purpureus TaxID=3225 RepID=A0A8T0H3H6_CERPU|nr:hypothetical protein KC19_7G065300 [Ceratodon purpureus]